MKKAIRKTVILSLLFFWFTSIWSQVIPKKEFTKKVLEADVFFYYDEDYEKAATLYESLLNIYPDNSNLSAKLGICYLNIDGKISEAINLLEKASANIVSNDKEYIEYGEKAPLDTYLYIAIAYHHIDSLQKAISLYSDAKRKLANMNIFSEEFIDNQIKNCRYAIEMKNKPLSIVSSIFIPWLVDYPGATNPVLSKNDSIFIFTLKKHGKTQIMCSYKSESWMPPIDITKQLGGYDRFYTNSITGNGRLLILSMDDGGDGNLYYSQRRGTTWSKIKNLGKNINTIYWESHGFITPDGKSLFIASNRPGGKGELDIWISEKDTDGSWKPPVNCGNMINTPYNENTPFFDQSSNTIYFSSLGHLSMGGYDVFRSTKRNGVWTTPTGLPYAFNNTSENTFFILKNNGPGFITSLYENTFKSRNIYSMFAEDPVEKIIVARGTISLQDGLSIEPHKSKIQLIDLKKGAQAKNIDMSDSVSFTFEIKPGDYQLFVSHTGYKTDTIGLSIPIDFSGNYIPVNASLVPEKVVSGEFLSIKNILFEFNSFLLTNEAESSLNILKTILANYPELKIEVAGYTDAKGSTEYNRKLADNRAQAVIDYLADSDIPVSRFVKKAYGKSNFAAVNTNLDGTDNPEGRKYNRRATFGIIDPQTGITISQETYTPEHLRQPSSVKYSIVLLQTADNLPKETFSSLELTDRIFLRSIKIDSVSLYTIGLFHNKYDASKYLIHAKQKGFLDSYIVTQYEINSASKTLLDAEAKFRQLSGKKVYTIQLKATRKQVNLNQFKGTEGIIEIFSSDGFYRYVAGEFNSYTDAKIAVKTFIDAGYKDAFIRELNELNTEK